MPEFYDPVELFWEGILSRQPDQIRSAFNSVDKTTQQDVLAHLQDMATGEGWHPEQVTSARIALEVLEGE